MFSVVIPTFKRPLLLRRAVASVFSQTISDWELIVSDDESGDSETWSYLCELQKSDPRVHVIKNTGAHGQAGNVNNCLRRARGEWIKPLFDDDVLLPQCLEAFGHAVECFPNVVLAGCLAKHYLDGQLVKVDRVPTRTTIEIVEQKNAHLAMYLQDLECGGMPTQMLMRRSAIDKGALMPDDKRFVSAIDQLWFAEILRHGDRMHLALVLVEEHQGGHDTVTGAASRDALDRDNLLLREHLNPLMAADIPRPSLQVISEMVMGIRGMHRLTGGHFSEGIRLIASVRQPVAAGYVMKWLLRKIMPGHFTATPRLRYSK